MCTNRQQLNIQQHQSKFKIKRNPEKRKTYGDSEPL
jgi:hypothetical protein